MTAARSSRPAALALVVAIGLAFAAYLLPELRPAPATLALLCTAVVAACFAWNLLWVGMPCSVPSLLYLVALTIFHLGLVVPCILGWAEPPLWLDAAATSALEAALLCVLLAFLCFELGVLAGWRQLGARPVVPVLAPTPRRTTSPLHTGGLFVVVLAVAVTALNVATIGVDRVLGASYGYELYASTDSRLLQTGLFLLLPAGSLIALAGARAGRETTRGLAAVAVATLALLAAGDRGGAVCLGAAALVVWTGTHGALPRRIVATGFVVVLLLVPAVATLRQLPRNSVSLAAVYDAARGASPLSALTEMGGSLRPLVETVHRVPADVPYRGGASYLSAAERLLPNVGLTRAGNAWTDPTTLPPNAWITYTVAPWSFAAFGGLGFSAVAEPYLNFGVVGVAAYFLVLGAGLGRLDLALARGLARRTLAIAAVVLMPLLITVRNDFHNFVRPALWSTALVLLIGAVHGQERRHHRRHVPTSAGGGHPMQGPTTGRRLAAAWEPR